MAKSENPPFPRGSYDETGAFANLAGREWDFEDLSWNTPGRPSRTNRQVTVRLVKNDSGGSLLPKRLGRFKANAGEYGAVVDGYQALTAGRGYLIDEFLPATGVPNGAYFYIVVGGPAMALTPLAGAGFGGNITVGGKVVALTAASAGDTAAGRLALDSAAAGSQIENFVGFALSARTTGETNSDLLVEVGKW